ncbi:MAG: ABC transporter permease [Tissierellales bacterium]|nr:ABC transporter permease [Tissierellales bacterium]MBN2826922.1 ABC transporter permease [Tissierellales bacterium]
MATQSENIEIIEVKHRTQLQEIWRRYKKNTRAVIGLIMLLILIFSALFASVLTPYDPLETNYSLRLEPPNAEHPFGTDELGRDILTRILYGTRISLTVGLIAVSISSITGCTLGSIAGYYGGRIDNIIMRFIDVIMAIPGILLNISIVAALGTGLQNVMIAIGISSIPGYCRIMRASILSLRGQEFIEASKAAGAKDFHIITTHIWPNAMAPILIQATLRIGGAILACASMSFIGLGIVPPTPEWGAMLSTGRDFLRDAPHLTAFPGMAIMFSVLAMNLMGDGLRDALDPKLKD